MDRVLSDTVCLYTAAHSEPHGKLTLIWQMTRLPQTYREQLIRLISEDAIMPRCVRDELLAILAPANPSFQNESRPSDLFEPAYGRNRMEEYYLSDPRDTIRKLRAAFAVCLQLNRTSDNPEPSLAAKIAALSKSYRTLVKLNLRTTAAHACFDSLCPLDRPKAAPKMSISQIAEYINALASDIREKGASVEAARLVKRVATLRDKDFLRCREVETTVADINVPFSEFCSAFERFMLDKNHEFRTENARMTTLVYFQNRFKAIEKYIPLENVIAQQDNNIQANVGISEIDCRGVTRPNAPTEEAHHTESDFKINCIGVMSDDLNENLGDIDDDWFSYQHASNS